MPEPVSSTIIPLAGKLASVLLEAAKPSALKIKEQLLLNYGNGLTKLLQDQIERHRQIKTILSGSTPLNLLEIYVNVTLQRDEKIVRDDDIFRVLKSERALLIHATAGSGKSMLLRYLLLISEQQLEDRFPVFIEFRDLNSAPGKSFVETIQETIDIYIDGFTRSQTDYVLRSGKYYLF